MNNKNGVSDLVKNFTVNSTPLLGVYSVLNIV